MKIVVTGDLEAFELLKSSNPDGTWLVVESADSFPAHNDADAFFDLGPGTRFHNNFPGEIPYFINSVVQTLGENNHMIRINGWKGFLQNSTWEVAGKLGDRERRILDFLHKKVIETADEPGFISPRIIAMIINEAYHAKEEAVSTEQEIDIAMKLGTNYPNGPFEWADKIGHQNIYDLLQELALSDKRYTPASSLANLVHQQ